ncbi:ABC transporter permease [Streptomyces sp. NPDC056161]|uniref:ABC transporter permease n=1 Tax=Streptomyces sp. NPDC056161 TaxID=3345732 RepID=UPI0035DA01AD
MSTYNVTHGTPQARQTVRRGPARPGGMLWLVWRQHRAAFRTLIAVTVVAVAAVTYGRGQMMDYLTAQGWPHPRSGWQSGIGPHADHMFQFGTYLGYLPLLIGVFVGAPLLAGDLETGTARLVTAQSVSRTRWLTAKLGLTGAVLTALTAALSAVLGWWWAPVKGRVEELSWGSSAFFDTTGIVPVAFTLLAFSVGAAVGLVLRRTLVSMVVTFGIVAAVLAVWDRFRLNLGHVLTATTNQGVAPDAPQPKLPAAAVQMGQGTSFRTSSGQRLDWTTCLSRTEGPAHTSCLEAKHVVGYATDYLPISQMPTMQWLGAGILLALSAALTVFVFLWGRKQPM